MENSAKDTSTIEGFNAIKVEADDTPEARIPVTSPLSKKEAITEAELLDLNEGEGSFMFYPKSPEFDVAVGKVFYLRERESGETGVVIQVFNIGTASYPQDDVKALFRLNTAVRARLIERNNYEPHETIDEFLKADFKVRAVIRDATWGPNDGHSVTRNVDFFELDPEFVLENCTKTVESMNVALGQYDVENFEFSGGLLDKVNVITGMKGGGKSHIAKGIIDESRKVGMSSVVFDINDNDAYDKLPEAYQFEPGVNLRFRMDMIQPNKLLSLFRRLAPFPERTSYLAESSLPQLLKARMNAGRIPDLTYLEQEADGGMFDSSGPGKAMKDGFLRSLEIIGTYNLLMTEKEAKEEDDYVFRRAGTVTPSIFSPRTVFFNIFEFNKPSVIVANLSGMARGLQESIVDLMLDYLRELCSRQSVKYNAGEIDVPTYPSVFFEEAHMYMEPSAINELVPVVRHVGMNLFFVTNTPGALPDSVFRLADNVFLTRMLNKSDIERVKSCGLADGESIEGFAKNLPDRHVLILSGRERVTNQFPLIVRVNNFGFDSGTTRSMWQALENRRVAAGGEE